MMTDEELNQAYIKLRAYHEHFLKFFDYYGLKDSVYFEFAIKGEISSHCIGGIMNILERNATSQGLAHNARALIEDLALFEMYKKGKIKKKNLEVFRKMFFIVEQSNLKMVWNSDEVPEEIKKQYDDGKNAILNQITDALECSRSDIRNIDGPLIFLYKKSEQKEYRKSKNGVSEWSEIITKYLGKEANDERNLMGIRIHPYYLSASMNDDKREHAKNIFLKYLKKAMDTIASGVVIPKNKNNETLEDELLRNKNWFEHYKRFRRLNDLMFSIFAALKNEGDNTNQFDGFAFQQLGALYYDMRLCFALGYPAQTVAKFKSFMEMAATYEKVRSYPIDERGYIEEGFLISTQTQYSRYFSEESQDANRTLRRLYDQYYGEKTGKDFAFFKNIMTKNDRFSFTLDEDAKYAKIVTEFLENNKYEEDKFIYQQSLDFDHGGGYLYESSKYLADGFAIFCIMFMNKYLLRFMRGFLLPTTDEKIADAMDAWACGLLADNKKLYDILKNPKDKFGEA